VCAYTGASTHARRGWKHRRQRDWPARRATLVGLSATTAAGADIARRCASARIDLVPLRDGRPTTVRCG
jgi:transcriptional regulator with AAA-type ATPase domain